jgi:O-antigen/teichoic acid export membrane protein
MRSPLSGLSPTSWVTAQNVFKHLFAIGLFAIQAPMLGPHAFGLIALVMVFIGFCEQVLEIASIDGLISVKDIDERHYATMNAVNIAFALALAALIFVFAGRIAVMFREPELELILRIMALLPLLSLLGAAPNAACRRELQFEPLVKRVFVSTLASGAVGLVLTLMHYGVWALVWQAIVQRLMNVAIVWKLVNLRFRIGFSLPHFRELQRYAAPMLLTQSMSWLGEQAPRYILGFFLGATELGLYSLAGRLCDVVLQLTLSPRYAVARVEMREFIDRPGIEVAMRRVLTQMSALAFPACIGGVVLMPLLFSTWLNARWADGVVPAQLMILGLLPYVTHYGLSAALLGTNRQSAIAINATAQTLIVIPVTAVSAPFGLYTATAAIACRPLLTATIPMLFARHYCGLAPKDVLLPQVPALLASAATGAVIWGLNLLLAPYLNQVVLLAWLMLAGAVTYAALIARLLPEVAAWLMMRLPALRGRSPGAN